MGKPQTIEVHLESDVVASLDRLASRWGCSREHVITTAILLFLHEETAADEGWAELPVPPARVGLEVLDDAAKALHDFIQEGIDSAEREPLVDHADVIAELRRRRRKDAA